MFTFFFLNKHYVNNFDQILFLQPLRVKENKRKNHEPTTRCHTFCIKLKNKISYFLD